MARRYLRRPAVFSAVVALGLLAAFFAGPAPQKSLANDCSAELATLNDIIALYNDAVARENTDYTNLFNQFGTVNTIASTLYSLVDQPIEPNLVGPGVAENIEGTANAQNAAYAELDTLFYRIDASEMHHLGQRAAQASVGYQVCTGSWGY